MRRRKRVSKRRWKARCRIGRSIPLEAIHEHDLQKWFTFEQVNQFIEYYTAKAR